MNSQIVKKIRSFLEPRGWFFTEPAHLAKSVSIEAAELLEHFQWSNPSVENIKKDEEVLQEMGKEIADVLIYALHLAELLDLDYQQLIEEKLKIADKKFPVEEVKGPAGGKRYLQLKKEWRKKETI